jgi:hypothetical protein
VKPITLGTLWPLWAGVVMTLTTHVLAFSPVIWHLSGAPAEFYPELFFMTFLVPISSLLLLGGAAHAWIVIVRRRTLRPDGELRG